MKNELVKDSGNDLEFMYTKVWNTILKVETPILERFSPVYKALTLNVISLQRSKFTFPLYCP